MAGSPKSGKGGPVNLLKPSPRSKGADSAKGCAKCRHALTGCARCNPKKLAAYLDKKRRRAEEEGLDPEQVKLPCWASRGTAKAEGKRNKGPRSGASEGKKKKKRRKKVQVSRAPEGTKKRKKKDEPKPKGGKVGVLWSPGHGKEGRFYYGRIVKYDEAKGLHQVCYDDGEVQVRLIEGLHPPHPAPRLTFPSRSPRPPFPANQTKRNLTTVAGPQARGLGPEQVRFQTLHVQGVARVRGRPEARVILEVWLHGGPQGLAQLGPQALVHSGGARPGVQEGWVHHLRGLH